MIKRWDRVMKDFRFEFLEEQSTTMYYAKSVEVKKMISHVLFTI